MLENDDKEAGNLSTSLFITVGPYSKAISPPLELHHDVPNKFVCLYFHPPLPKYCLHEAAKVLFSKC